MDGEGGSLGNRDDDLGMINRMIWSGVEVMVFIEYGDWWRRVIGGGRACVREISIRWGRGVKARRVRSIGKCKYVRGSVQDD